MSSIADLERLYLGQVLPRFRTWTGQTRAALGTRAGSPPIFSLWESPVHGVGHYARVGCLALALHERRRELEAAREHRTIGGPMSPKTTEALLLAAFFHDSGRINEYRDPAHGRAGERIFRAFAGRVVPAPVPAVRDVVSAAIIYHCGGGAGWPDAVATAIANADRLDRIRFGDAPDPGQMCDDEGAWRTFAPLASGFVQLVSSIRVHNDVGPTPAS